MRKASDFFIYKKSIHKKIIYIFVIHNLIRYEEEFVV